MKFPFVVPVNGIQSYMPNVLKANPEIDSDVVLVPEPTNEYDPLAIAIYCNDVHIGYLPKTLASRLSAAYPGRAFKGTVTTVYREKDDSPCGIRINVLGFEEIGTKISEAWSKGGKKLGTVKHVEADEVTIILSPGVELKLSSALVDIREP